MSDTPTAQFTPLSEDALWEMSNSELAQWVEVNQYYFPDEFQSFYHGLPDDLQYRIIDADSGSSSGFATPATGGSGGDGFHNGVDDGVDDGEEGSSSGARAATGGWGDDVWPDEDGIYDMSVYVEDGDFSTQDLELDPRDRHDAARIARVAQDAWHATDWARVRDDNKAAIKEMVSNEGTELPFLVGRDCVLLGTEHQASASEYAGWEGELNGGYAHGTLRFKRNRLSPNEFVITLKTGQLDDTVLANVVKEHIRDHSIYPYRDADRVRFHR